MDFTENVTIKYLVNIKYINIGCSSITDEGSKDMEKIKNLCPDRTHNILHDSTTNSRGIFIVLEGLDRSGKSSQIDNLVKYMRRNGNTVYETHFPDRETESGKLLDLYLRNKSNACDETAHLIFSANRWEKAADIRTRVESKGQVVVCSRYAYSGVAYTYMKGKRSLQWCKSSDSGLPEPDLVIFLDIQPKNAQTRCGYGEERYEQVDTQNKVREAFQLIFKDDPRIVSIDASQSIEDVHKDIVKAVHQKWNFILEEGSQPLGKLWE